MRILNFDLLASPLNWFTVTLVVAFGLMLIAIVSPQEEN